MKTRQEVLRDIYQQFEEAFSQSGEKQLWSEAMEAFWREVK